MTIRQTSLRWCTALLLVAVAVAACGDDAETSSEPAANEPAATTTSIAAATSTLAGTPPELAISYQNTWHSDTRLTEWQATGPAVDEGLICPQATASGGRFELEDGTPLTEAELDALNDKTDPLTYLAIAEMSCVDDPGGFTIRRTTVATNPAAFEETSTWQLQGNEGYDDVTGEGHVDEMTIDGQPVTIVSQSSGVLRRSSQ